MPEIDFRIITGIALALGALILVGGGIRRQWAGNPTGSLQALAVLLALIVIMAAVYSWRFEMLRLIGAGR